jgi:predicted NodU family carbamoyl transferase
VWRTGDTVTVPARNHADENFETRVLTLKEAVDEFDPPAVARALQEHTEQLLSEFVSAAVERTEITDIALVGGVTANVSINGSTSCCIEGLPDTNSKRPKADAT